MTRRSFRMNRKSLISLLLVLVMLLSIAAPSMAEAAAGDTSIPLVVAYDEFSEKFSPFFGDTGYDVDVTEMVLSPIIVNDRLGGLIYNGIGGETHAYNGIDYTYKGIADVTVDYDEAADVTTYTAKLRDDVKFSDGELMNADDIIFSFYVYLDNSYVGSTTLNSYKIVGYENYKANNSLAEGMDVEGALANPDDALKAAIAEKAVLPMFIDEMAWAKDAFEDYKAAGYTTAEDGVGMFVEFYAIDAIDTAGMAEEEIIAAVAAQYGADYKAAAAAYGDAALLDAAAEGAAMEYLLENAGEAGEEVANIAGIKKIDDLTVEVKTYGYEAPAVYTLFGILVAPMHYYGDVELYDYDNNMFGFPRGDVSIVEAKTTHPMGSGAYKFVKYENRTVYFEANENYYKGEPKTKYIQFKETDSAEVISAVSTGTADAGELSGTKARYEEVAGINSNGELQGDKIYTSKVDNLGYGYIGINADTMNVGGVADSDASKNLRRAFATILAVHRDVSIDSFYGDAASVINYPVSNTSWAAPRPTDEDYKVAFSTDVEGNPIYTSDMIADDKYVAAIEAAKGFLLAAGYTFDEAQGIFTAAPDGAKLSYEIIIPGDGIGDHPSFSILTDAAAALKTIGIELKINDPANGNVMWDALDAGSQEMWCAAWQSTIDPDMYQVYHSSGVVGAGGSDSNHYHIRDAELDRLIVEARKSDDQSFRKAVYKQALDVIIDWAVEIPIYQRQNCFLFSAERVDLDSTVQDITTFYDWMQEVENLKMVGNG
ncbi:MAG: ABC transporter substrate-binding protein [Clostridiales bacterium]|nr:ABC transporter substrate-binding protein [Clostridiales bacterium]